MDEKDRALFDMDRLGILPFIGEDQEKFLMRAHTMLAYSLEGDLRRRIFNMYTHSPGFAAARQQWGISSYNLAEPDELAARLFRKGVLLFNRYTKADLSWIPLISFSDFGLSLVRSKILFGCTVHLPLIGNYYAPLFLVRRNRSITTSKVNTGVHEAFHALRLPITCERNGGIHAEQFDHLGSLMRTCIRRWIPRTPEHQVFLFSWLVLRKYFGENAFYALARLAYSELEFVIQSAPDFSAFAQYMRHASTKSLRHYIMCKHLGLT